MEPSSGDEKGSTVRLLTLPVEIVSFLYLAYEHVVRPGSSCGGGEGMRAVTDMGEELRRSSVIQLIKDMSTRYYFATAMRRHGDQCNLSPARLLLCLLMISSFATSQERTAPDRVKVMTLGVFHFNFPNLDVRKTEDKDKIDVLEEKYQRQIVRIVEALKAFRPTRIVVEVQPASQKSIDSLYEAYRHGTHSLGRSETEQLGFRLANALKLDKLECVDTWGKGYESLDYLFSDTSSRAKAFEHYYFNNPDTVYSRNNPGISLATDSGIIENLLSLNDPQTIKESLGSYLIGHFKYEEQPGDYTGVDFETGRWFNRNLRIFRNIQRVTKSPADRILVIFGAGHMNILNYLFECSPEYELVSPVSFIRDHTR